MFLLHGNWLPHIECVQKQATVTTWAFVLIFYQMYFFELPPVSKPILKAKPSWFCWNGLFIFEDSSKLFADKQQKFSVQTVQFDTIFSSAIIRDMHFIHLIIFLPLQHNYCIIKRAILADIRSIDFQKFHSFISDSLLHSQYSCRFAWSLWIFCTSEHAIAAWMHRVLMKASME